MPSSRKGQTLSLPVAVLCPFQPTGHNNPASKVCLLHLLCMKGLRPEWLNVSVQLGSGRARIQTRLVYV